MADNRNELQVPTARNIAHENLFSLTNKSHFQKLGGIEKL